MLKRKRRFPIALGLLVVLLGCGSDYDIVPVHGKVTYDGHPVPDVVVKFQPKEGRTSEGVTTADGSFEMLYMIDEKGVERDKHDVIVYWISPTDDRTSKPSLLARKVLDDFKAKGPIEITVDKAMKEFEIKLPR